MNVGYLKQVAEPMQISVVHAGMDSLRVSWEDGNQTSIHYISLRDSCSCDECRHPDVGERLLDSTLIPVDIRPERVELTSSGQVEIHWSPDHHHSTYDAGSVRRPRDREISIEPMTLWDAELIGKLPEVAYETIISDGEALLNWLRRLREYGITLVRDVPICVAEVAKVAERIGALRTSNFGTVFNVESKPKPNALAYTAPALPPHTDLVAREYQPGYQFLHCLEFEATGGDSQRVDGFRAAQRLKGSTKSAMNSSAPRR